jgi:hypothetical protein
MKGEIKHPQAIKVLIIVLWLTIVILAGMLVGFLIVSCSKLTSKAAPTLASTPTSLNTSTPLPPSSTPVPPTSSPTSVPSNTSVPPTSSPSPQSTPSPSSTVTASVSPTYPPTQNPTETEQPSPQPVIDNPTIDPGQCPYNTHLTYGMYAFVQKTINLYDIPRYEQKTGYEDPQIIFTLQPGDRVWITSEYFPATMHQDARNPQCERKSYWWYIQTAFEDPEKDPHVEGWAFEYYYKHPKDDYAYFYEGYYLGPQKPK